jgi:hypothetical protein
MTQPTIETAKLRKVDANGNRKRPLWRHLAVINRILVCGYAKKPGERGDILNGEVAATRCGMMLRHFSTADDVSLLNTEGGEYARECPTCFDGWVEPEKKVVAFRAYTSDAEPGSVFVAMIYEPSIYYRLTLLDAARDVWTVRPLSAASAPLRGERVAPNAPILTKGVFAALNQYFVTQVAIQ